MSYNAETDTSGVTLCRQVRFSGAGRLSARLLLPGDARGAADLWQEDGAPAVRGELHFLLLQASVFVHHVARVEA
jgi:hypothetical protein